MTQFNTYAATEANGAKNLSCYTARQKPAKVFLDVWADLLLKKKSQSSGNSDHWLVFRTKQLDDNDRVWVEKIQRKEKQIIVVANQAKWKGKYFRNFTYYAVVGVNLGKLQPGSYEAKWILKPVEFTKFDGDGKPNGNWPKEERAVDRKPAELRVTFVVGKNGR